MVERNQAQRIALSLEDMILCARYRTGERLDEARLADKFGVSRTPVREALRLLVDTGLAQQLPRRGVFVQEPNPITLIEMFETMAEIEGVCSKLATQRVTPETITSLKAINEECNAAINAQDAVGYSIQNEAFHRLIYRTSGNSFLEEQAIRLFRLLRPFRRIQFQIGPRMAQSVSEHLALLDAMTSGQDNRAAELARGHVAAQGERYYAQIAQLRGAQAMRHAG